MTNQSDRFPSSKIQHNPPSAWIQWQGTQVCMDIQCACGRMSHVDAEFCFHVKCPSCGATYECDPHITLHKLDFEPEGTIEAAK